VIGQTHPVAFEDIKSLQFKESRPVAVLIMTSWCKYCHAMKNTMLKNKNISLLLSDKFYVVFLNAEEKKDIVFAGRRFKHKAGVHELARELTTINGKVSYPSFCVLNHKNEIIYQNDGFLSPDAMMFILKKITETANNI
jgi:thioredoxin-related protein